MDNKVVDIGFLEERENWLLHPRFFPSKVGGKPAWLDLKYIPSSEELTCKICGDPLTFLCQVNIFILLIPLWKSKYYSQNFFISDICTI